MPHCRKSSAISKRSQPAIHKHFRRYDRLRSPTRFPEDPFFKTTPPGASIAIPATLIRSDQSLLQFGALRSAAAGVWPFSIATKAGPPAGPGVKDRIIPAAPAALGGLTFEALNSAGAPVAYAGTHASVTNVRAGKESGYIELCSMFNGETAFAC